MGRRERPDRRGPESDTVPAVSSLGRALPLLVVAALGCSAKPPAPTRPLGYLPEAVTTAEPEWIPWSIRAGKAAATDPREVHLTELRQLTFGGENAEAYWSPDGKKLIFQSTRDGAACDQMFVMDLGDGATTRVSSGRGRTTCGYFVFPAGKELLYASTEASSAACPPKPDRSQGYVWPLEEHDVYTASADGSGTRRLLGGPGYDAETTMAFDGSRLVFTSTRDGDLDLYTARPDGSDVRRVTRDVGYDGGAFFSPDATKLVWRAARPTGPALDRYRTLLQQGLVEPRGLEIVVGDVDGRNATFVTKNGRNNFAPSFFPDSRRVIFASDVHDGSGGKGPPDFDLYVVDPEAPPTTTGSPPLERVTFAAGFDGFPMFSPDGRYVAFASNRGGATPGETNLFVARWVP